MDINIIIYATFFITIIDLGFALVRTYINYKTLSESRVYWHSWKKRKKDVAKDILGSLTIRQLKRELRKREKKN